MSSSAPPGQRSATHLIQRGSAAWMLAWLCMVVGMSLSQPAAAQTESVLANFTGNSGAAPGRDPGGESLIQASDGNLYGVASQGGTCSFQNGCGTLYKISPAGTYTLLHSFTTATTDGINPLGALVEGTDGNIYGTTYTGGAGICSSTPGCGTVFSITSSGIFRLLHSFSGSDGTFPFGGLVQGNDGSFYGTTPYGGTNYNCEPSNAPGYPDCGTVFKITPTGAFTLLHSFSGADGGRPVARLVQGNDGSFYGTTSVGGASYGPSGQEGAGTVFKISSTGTFTLLHSFSGPDGGFPAADLVQGADGNFYGTTSAGGANICDDPYGCGSIFKITPSGAFTLLHSFSDATTDGFTPFGGLVLGTDGNYYGTTYFGGSMVEGTIFNISPAGTLRSNTLFRT